MGATGLLIRYTQILNPSKIGSHGLIEMAFVIREFFVMRQIYDGILTLVIAPDVMAVNDYLASIEKPQEAEWIIEANVGGRVSQTVRVPVPSKGPQRAAALSLLRELPRLARLDHGDIVIDASGHIYQYDADSPEFGYFTNPLLDEDGEPLDDNALTCEHTEYIRQLRRKDLGNIISAITARSCVAAVDVSDSE